MRSAFILIHWLYEAGGDSQEFGGGNSESMISGFDQICNSYPNHPMFNNSLIIHINNRLNIL
jgi:hypothetical protein